MLCAPKTLYPLWYGQSHSIPQAVAITANMLQPSAGEFARMEEGQEAALACTAHTLEEPRSFGSQPVGLSCIESKERTRSSRSQGLFGSYRQARSKIKALEPPSDCSETAAFGEQPPSWNTFSGFPSSFRGLISFVLFMFIMLLLIACPSPPFHFDMSKLFGIIRAACCGHTFSLAKRERERERWVCIIYRSKQRSQVTCMVKNKWNERTSKHVRSMSKEANIFQQLHFSSHFYADPNQIGPDLGLNPESLSVGRSKHTTGSGAIKCTRSACTAHAAP